MRPICFSFLFFLSLRSGLAQNAKSVIGPGAGGFIENKGQITDQNGHPNSAVRYLLSMPGGMKLQIKNNGFSYDTYTSSEVKKQKQKIRHFAFHRVDIVFENANANLNLIPELPLTTEENYFNSPGHPSLHVRSYQRVALKNLYPSIDLIFDCSKGSMEYFFVVHPGGDPQQIRMKWNGANATSLNENRIAISVDKGSWQETLPESYTDSTSRFQRNKSAVARDVPVSYRQLDKDLYGFTPGTYNKKATLIIDPTPDLIWGTYLGGYLNDWGYALAADAQGNIFMGGASNNSSLATSGAYKTTIDGYMDAFLGKFSPDGAPVWITYYGGENEEEIYGVSIDQENNVIGLGSTFSFNNISTAGSYKTTKTSPEGSADAFIIKFTNDGSLIWCTYYGGDESVIPTRVATDRSNNIFITGATNCTSGISSPGSLQPEYSPTNTTYQEDAFLAKFNAGGNFIWGTYFGGNDYDRFNALAVDKNQDVVVTGISRSTNLPVSPGAYQTSRNGPDDAVILKFSNDGKLIWSTNYGGEGSEYSSALCVDDANNIFIAGVTGSTQSMSSAGSQQPVKNIDLDGFLAKFNSSGSRVWGTYIGGEGQEYIEDITCDVNGNIDFCGTTSSSTNISTPGSFQPGIDIWGTLFIERYNNNGFRQWGTYYGQNGIAGSASDAYGIASYQDYVYITGETTDLLNISTCDAWQPYWSANGDAFLAKFGVTLIPACVATSVTNGTLCTGQNSVFHATASNLGRDVQYQWYRNDVPVGTDDSVYIDNSPLISEQVYCLVQNCSGKNTASNKITLTSDPGLNPSVSIASPTDSVCTGTNVIISSSVQNAGTNPMFQWQVNGVNAGTDTSSFISGTLKNGDLITCFVTNPQACTVNAFQSNEIRIKMKTVPRTSITISADKNPVCPGATVSITAAVINGGNVPDFQWMVNGATQGTNDFNFPGTSFSDGDQITCLLTPDIAGCRLSPVLSNSITMQVYPSISVSIEGKSISSTPGATQLSASINGAYVSFSWSPVTYLSDAMILNPIATPLTSTTYRLNVADANGCKTSQDFLVSKAVKISIPNAFTPNGDGVNDLFRAIYGSDINHVTFMVYNRWGQLVFSDNGSQKGWDGTIHGSPQPDGAYVWFFKYTDANGVSRLLKGSVILTR